MRHNQKGNDQNFTQFRKISLVSLYSKSYTTRRTNVRIQLTAWPRLSVSPQVTTVVPANNLATSLCQSSCNNCRTS